MAQFKGYDMAIDPAGVKMNAVAAGSLRAHWKFFMGEGVVLLILGLAAIILPQVASVAIAILLGWLLLMSGIVGLLSSFAARHAPGFGWSLLSAAAGIAAGVVLLASPLSGVVTLTLVLSAFLCVEGIVSIFYSLEHRRELTGRWAMLLFSGLVDLLLAALIFAGLPGSAGWAIGVLVGINLVMGGTALIAMALHARSKTPSSV
jgi:uncharacterized membrane protein HdeD (DUF308 family)